MESKELSCNLRCILMRDGVEIWVEEERLANLKNLLQDNKRGIFVEIDDETINTSDISGIYTPQRMEDVVRKKQGQWKDKNGNWHNREERICPKCGNILPYGKVCGRCS